MTAGRLDPSSLRMYKKKKMDRDQAVAEWIKDVERHTQPTQRIQFKSEAAKRAIQKNALIAPDETCQIHRVPRRLLMNHHDRLLHLQQTADKIQSLSQTDQASRVGRLAMVGTGERTPLAGMIQLVIMMQRTLHAQEQQSTQTIHRLESLLADERQKRQAAIVQLEALKKKGVIKKMNDPSRLVRKWRYKKKSGPCYFLYTHFPPSPFVFFFCI